MEGLGRDIVVVELRQGCSMEVGVGMRTLELRGVEVQSSNILF